MRVISPARCLYRPLWPRCRHPLDQLLACPASQTFAESRRIFDGEHPPPIWRRPRQTPEICFSHMSNHTIKTNMETMRCILDSLVKHVRSSHRRSRIVPHEAYNSTGSPWETQWMPRASHGVVMHCPWHLTDWGHNGSPGLPHGYNAPLIQRGQQLPSETTT